jgi:REP element-mobilizing transposase RayT
MPRKPRLDAPGCLHHIITRGIDHQSIFKDKYDRENFIDRLGTIITHTDTTCYAWCLMPNHFHLLFKTGPTPIATVMRRLLTGHAIYFNRRHHRNGHLFQNRYKSILCQEDAYLKELIRYIHLNPLRASIVPDMKALDSFRYSGHSAIMDKYKHTWQSTEAVLQLFGDGRLKARQLYRRFIQAGIDKGRRPDLVGGGLVRSAGGWTAVKSLRKAGYFLKSDERILGDSDFVNTVLAEANEQLDRKYEITAKGFDLEKLIQVVARFLSLKKDDVFGPSKKHEVVLARNLICYWGISELGLTATQVSKNLGISVSTASSAASRGRQVVSEKGFSFELLMNTEIQRTSLKFTTDIISNN